MSLHLVIPGKPRGQGRPRFARVGAGVRTYTDAETRSYAERVQTEWIAAGRPMVPKGPYSVRIAAFMERPAGHFKRDGSLSASGVRSPYPTGKPDADNIAKLVLDALTGVGALPDDALCVRWRVVKEWGETANLVVEARALEAAAA